ncbi:MAG TPA: tRNA (adenosine(37)-N6)-threonylcarbamoyltransferase complex dimerization subunit type 1 TsaB, partial [Candidatus Limnocylindrales bacterium]|nr:tRNA (adenosine(37)-N6)-threonylcarbamoyltransferase complex dimerization subunit type 1 TsaB [Candidatus Limnocylindrales bacterium]
MSERWLLAIDTATSVVVVAAGRPDGSLLEVRTFPAEHRHGSHLLPTIQALAADRKLALADLAGVVVGTGPGAFTGLRVGLATAKVLAHELAVPLVGVATSEALLAAEPGARVLLLPAGPHDRTIVERGAEARLLAG